MYAKRAEELKKIVAEKYAAKAAFITNIRDLYMDSIWVNRAEVILDLKGDERLPISNVSVKNIYVKELTDSVKYVRNAENIVLEELRYNN